jgi:superfamily II DNA or RNA helicase
MLNLRPYQQEAIDAIEYEFTQRQSQYIELPTGSGKTVTFLSYAKKRHSKILIIVPTKELLKQVYEASLKFYDKSQISRKGSNFDEFPKDVHICIINSVRQAYLDHISHCNFDLIIVDEAHHIQANSYLRLLKTFSHVKTLGVTATPDRADGKFIQSLLGEHSYKIECSELIHQGFLSDIEGYVVKTGIDISEIDDHNSDFSLNELYKKLCTESRNKMIVDLCKDEMRNRKTLIFCINVAHSKKISELLSKEKISCAHIDGSTNNTARNSILSSFREGEISCLCNCQLLTEGFDEPSIDGIILARPTKSRALFNQMIGRGLRIFPGKENCKIIDVVDNHRNLRGFNSLITDEKRNEITSFKGIKQVEEHVNWESFKLIEFSIERADLIKQRLINYAEATPSMLEYLDNHKIRYFDPISFDEASFLIWFNELKKEYDNGNY